MGLQAADIQGGGWGCKQLILREGVGLQAADIQGGGGAASS